MPTLQLIVEFANVNLLIADILAKEKVYFTVCIFNRSKIVSK